MAYSCVRVIFEIGHEASLRAKKTPEGFTHDWEVFVRGVEGAEIVHFVEKVIFYLHDSFPRPKRVVKEPPFLVKESGYAGFILPIEICFKNKDEPKNVVYDYDLHLQSSGPPINKTIHHKYYFTNPSEELRRRLIKGGGVGVGSEGGPYIEKSLPEEEVINNSQSPSVGKPKPGGELSKKHKEYKIEERLNNSTSHLGVHPQKTEKVSSEGKKIPSPLPKPIKPVEKLEKSSGSKDSGNKERDKSKDKSSSKYHSSPKPNKEDTFAEKPLSSDSRKKKDKKNKDEKEAKRHESKHSDKTDKVEKIEKSEKVSKSEKPSKDKDAGSKKLSTSSSSSLSSSLLKDPGLKSLEKPKEKEKEKHSGDKERDKEKQKHKHKKKERNRKEEEKEKGKSSSRKSKSQDKEKVKRPPSPPVQVYTSPISFVSSSSSQPEVSQEKASKICNSTDSEVSVEESAVTSTVNSISNKKKDKSKVEQTVSIDENNKKESGKKRKRKSTKGSEEQPGKKVAIAEENIFTEEYVSELKELQRKIMTLEDSAELQKLVQVITETGQYEVTTKSFDFDLCVLDKATIKRLQDFFSSPRV